MTSPAHGLLSTVTDMDFDSPPLTPNKEKEDAAQQEQIMGAEAEDVQRKFNEIVAIRDDEPDARYSVNPEESRLDLAIPLEDLTLTDADGVKCLLHNSNETQRVHCHLGGGSFGDVFRVSHPVHKDVAVKLAKPGKEDLIEMYKKEIDKHVKCLPSEQIVSIKGFVQCTEKDCNCGLVGFVMKYMKRGSLWDFRTKMWKDVPNLTNGMVYQISSGMHFLHSKDIIHRDLKLENVLIDADLKVKIADLGLATNLRTSFGDNCFGTNSHKPPEAFRTDLPSSTKVVTKKYDVYSFSMTLYQLLTGISPYSDREFDMIRLLKVEARQTPSLRDVPENTTPELIRIMEESWRYEPDHRPDFEDITNRVEDLGTEPTHESLAVYFGPYSSPSSNVKNGEGVPPSLKNLTLNDHASAKPHGRKTGTSPTPTTEAIPESSSQSLSAICGPKGDVWRMTPSKPPIAPEVIPTVAPDARESTQTPMFGQKNEYQSNVESQTRAEQSAGSTGLVSHTIEDPPRQRGFAPVRSDMGRDEEPGRQPAGSTGFVSHTIEDPPRQSGFAPSRSDMGHDKEPGKWSESKGELLSNPPVRNKQEAFSLHTQYRPVQPDQPGANTLHSRSRENRPVPADSRQGRSEFALGSMEGGTTYIHSESSPEAQSQPSSSVRDPTIVFDSTSLSDQDFESSPEAQSQPSSSVRDPTIVFDSTSLSDQDFEINLLIRLNVPMRASISSKMDQILGSLERCKQRDYWPQTNNSLCTLFLSHEFTLRTLQLPPTLDDDQFTLFLRVSDKSALEKLHKFSKDGLLLSLLFPFFVDRLLEDICRPVKPDLKVDQWDEQYSRGIKHFEKKEKDEDSRQPKREHSESRSERPKETKPNVSFTQKDCKGATQINTGKVSITMNSAPKNMIVGDQHNTYYHYHGAEGKRQGRGGGKRTEDTDQRQSQNKTPEKPKLCESTQKVNETTLLDVVDVIPGDAVKSLGRHLGLPPVQVDNIVYEKRFDRSSETAYCVLLEWKQQRGQQATKAVLANALWKAKCYDAARNVR